MRGQFRRPWKVTSQIMMQMMCQQIVERRLLGHSPAQVGGWAQ